MPRFFIDRPVFATVISVVITLICGLAIFSLSIAQYPEVVPPQVRVTAAYRGANAQDVEKTVAAPIEQQLVGLDDLLYLSSSSSNDGILTITLTFEVGTDLDLAAVQVQNKVALAIGIVVDDAIVVVEAVQHNIDTKGLSSREATIRAMDAVSGPVIAIAFILSAVFIPVAFLGGITGQIYRNFALTIAVAVLLSALNALTLSPALSALLLRPARSTWGPLRLFYRGFNWAFDRSTRTYLQGVRLLVRRTVFALVALAAVYAGTYGLFQIVPTGFLPDEDQGAFFVSVRLPDGASLERTDAILRRLEEILKPAPAIANVLTLGGFDLIAGTNNTNVGSLVAILRPWEERESPQLQVDAILARVQREFNRIQGALVFGLTPPPFIGLGTAGGFEFAIQDRAGRDLTELAAATNALLAAARERPELTNMSSPFRVSVPQLSVSLDRDKAETLGIPVTDVYDALQTFLGGVYVNDFNLFGRTWKVLMQADADFRRSPDDVDRFYVRTQGGLMVPLTALISIKTASGPEVVYRYNRYRAARIFGAVAPGYSSGLGSAVMEELAAKVLPAGFGYEWTGTVYQQRKAEGQEPIIFGLSAILVLLLLAALYESWATPFAVVLSVPLGIFGALVGVWLRAYAYDVYTQIGIVTLIGLAAKNAILIVEFAKLRREEGLSIVDAAVEAARIRLRPILMTSFAFILGVVPLVIASGAGAGARRSLGTAVFAGMIAATALAIFIVPVLYVGIQRIAEGRGGQKAEPEPTGSRPSTVGRASTVTPTSDSAVSDLPQDHPIPDSATAPAYRRMGDV